MKKNMSTTDKLVRLIIAIIIGILIYSGVVEGTLAYILLALVIILALTSVLSFCPLYSLFGFNTCETKSKL